MPCERGLDWLLEAWPAEGTLWWRLRQSFISLPRWLARTARCAAGIGRPGTASWVEPTAHALLFLRSLPPELLPPQAAKRRQLAERMLFDRMCPGGGWNSGNPLVYGVAGVPRIGPTAWALLALRDHSERAEIQMSLAWLEGAYGGNSRGRVAGVGAPLPGGVWAAGRRRSHPHSASFTPITASLEMCSPWRGFFWR